MRPEDDEDDVEEDAQPIDPLADLLFGLIAIIVPAVAILLPMIQLSAGAVPVPHAAAVATFLDGDVRVDGKPANSIFAGPAGVRILGAGNPLIALDRVQDDQSLVRVLERARDDNEPLLLVIEPDGEEAAFVLEPLVARHGPSRIRQVRLDQGCTFVRDAALAAQCRAVSARGAQTR